ncbi:MAG: hypothetical protein IKB62_08095 [Oscillospiraceae bacterium]|nr:hypothetical protein [Oscillospiraceae bacterium]
MTVRQLQELLNLKCISEGSEDRELEGGFCGDLLSWVMGYGEYSQAWFTIMGNINAVAVASLHDMGCMVLCQNSTMQPDALAKAKEEGIWVFTTDMPTFEACGKYYEAIK